MTGRLPLDTWRALVGKPFRLHAGADRSFDFELIEARDIGGRPAASGEFLPCYSLVFRGPESGLVPQATYRIENEGIGALEVFLVPVGPDGAGIRYEAIFN
jgi:hypothetical protein